MGNDRLRNAECGMKRAKQEAPRIIPKSAFRIPQFLHVLCSGDRCCRRVVINETRPD